jgi:hypothetical protein
MSKVAQYGLSGILVCLALGSYLSFLAERDSKLLGPVEEVSTILPTGT